MNKKQQKELLIEIMEADARDGLYTKQTAVEWLFNQLYEKFEMKGDGEKMNEILNKAKAMEKEQRIKDYNAGYDDAQCNHINDAENYINESQYINHFEGDEDNF
jgi:hypothetical protein